MRGPDRDSQKVTRCDQATGSGAAARSASATPQRRRCSMVRTLVVLARGRRCDTSARGSITTQGTPRLASSAAAASPAGPPPATSTGISRPRAPPVVPTRCMVGHHRPGCTSVVSLIGTTRGGAVAGSTRGAGAPRAGRAGPGPGLPDTRVVRPRAPLAVPDVAECPGRPAQARRPAPGPQTRRVGGPGAHRGWPLRDRTAAAGGRVARATRARAARHRAALPGGPAPGHRPARAARRPRRA